MPSVEVEMVKRTVNAAMPLIGAGGVAYIGKMLQTCCVRCDIRDTCDMAYSTYNIDCEPKVDCLATK